VLYAALLLSIHYAQIFQTAENSFVDMHLDEFTVQETIEISRNKSTKFNGLRHKTSIFSDA
jgi:hypothetical protein